MKIIDLPFKVKCPILACGADMKGAFAIAKADKAYLVDGFGDLGDPDNLQNYGRTIKSLEKRLKIKPRVIVCDSHPGYFSGQFARTHARELKLTEPITIQHHQAHIASAIVEHSLKGTVIGVAFDGTGYGLDSHIWGGEFFVGSLTKMKRAGHLEYVPMPGAEAAVRQPWRMAVSYLYQSAGVNFSKLRPERLWKLHAEDRKLIVKMIDAHINTPMTSSSGRLFDAAASMILGMRDASYEAELPMALEAIASENCDLFYPCDIRFRNGLYIVNTSAIIASVAADIEKKTPREVLSSKFHNTIARLIARTAARVRDDSGVNRIILSGGVFQNRFLTTKTVGMLGKVGFNIYTHSAIHTNDTGVPIGQLAIANARGICV